MKSDQKDTCERERIMCNAKIGVLQLFKETRNHDLGRERPVILAIYTVMWYHTGNIMQ